MEKKKINKKVLIIIGIIILLVIGFIFRAYISNGIFYLRMLGVDKDITITRRESVGNVGGYASIGQYYYIDLDKKKIYSVENYHVFGNASGIGEAGNHYTLKGSKKLSDSELNKIIELANLGSDYDRSSMFDPRTGEYYYLITYNEKTTELNDSNAIEFSNIIANIFYN